MIDERLEEVFAAQETEDAHRLTKGLRQAMSEEFGDAGRVMEKIDFWMGANKDLNRHSIINNEPAKVLEFSIREALVRVSAEFSIRKHTTCLKPYFHSHDFYEMIYVWRGQCGQKIMGDEEDLILAEGDVCILTPGMVHAMLPCKDSDVILKMIIPSSMMRGLICYMEEGCDFESSGGQKNQENQKNQKNLKKRCNEKEEILFLESLKKKDKLYIFRGMQNFGMPNINTRIRMEHWVDELVRETYWGTDYRQSVIRSLLVLILVQLKRGDMEQMREGILQKVSAYIRNHIQDANLEEAANLMGYSGRQLRRKIAAASGGTFTDILWKIRMEEAATLLNGTDTSVEEVARLVGYDSTAGFYKRFSKVFGMTPAAYRKMYEV